VCRRANFSCTTCNVQSVETVESVIKSLARAYGYGSSYVCQAKWQYFLLLLHSTLDYVNLFLNTSQFYTSTEIGLWVDKKL
jgi:hypothetical protein